MNFGFAELQAAADLLSAELTASVPLGGGVDARGAAVLQEVASRLSDNYPYHDPLYAGQMLKPPHPVARLAYALAQLINPNNHALDGGRASSALEKEAVAELAAMFGWPQHLGHLTGGGTMANLEALWVAGQLHPGKVVLASAGAHYTHARICGVLGLPFEAIACDTTGRMRLDALAERLNRGDVGTVVVTLGTTGRGAVDPLDQIEPMARAAGARLHADAAYGGYFGLATTLASEARAAFEAARRVDSLAIDPHKHGLQPYGCGCVLFADPAVGRLYSHDSPYTYFTSSELHLGEISLECSRAGAAAAALWATQRLLPLQPGGEFSALLERCLEAARQLHARLDSSPHWVTLGAPQLDIVIWAARGATASEVSATAAAVFERAAESGLHLALLTAAREDLDWPEPDFVWDQERVTCLRSCLLKPEHLDAVAQIFAGLEQARQG